MRVLEDLTVPRAGGDTARLLFGEYLRLVTRRFLALPAERLGSAALGQVQRWARGLLAASRPGAVYTALRRPTVSVLVRVVDDAVSAGRRPDPRWLDELVALTALELVVAGERPSSSLDLPCPAELCVFGLRRAFAVPSDARLACGPDGATIRGPGFCVGLEREEVAPPLGELSAYHRLESGLVLATVDHNPLASLEAHPDKSGSQVDLGGHAVEAWIRALESALGIIGTHLPELASEMQLGLAQVIPVGFAEERHESASYAEAVGTVYSSLHPDPLTMAEALIHEFSHNKLNALTALEPLLSNTDQTFASPVRPDPRPLFGVLLAVHAFVPVALLYERMRAAHDPRALTPVAERRFRQVVQNNHEGTTTLLAHAQPSPAGAALLSELERWDRHFAGRP